MALAAQSVYPTGTPLFDPERSWNGYTVLPPLATQAVLVIDMRRDQLAAVFKDHQWLEPPSGPPPYLQP